MPLSEAYLYFHCRQARLMLFSPSVCRQASEELEERESLAQIAASGEDASLSDGETYIGKK